MFHKVEKEDDYIGRHSNFLAVDESENSHRVVQYVGSLLGRIPDVVVTIFHVLKPMPRGLLEHGGSGNPVAEAQLSVQLRDE